MHILEQYALNCGLKIGKPFIYEKLYPIPFEKYITFNPYGKFNSRKYSYWQEVINLLNPILIKNNIHIIQLGGPNEYGYHNCFHLMGKTDFNQSAFIIKNSLLHFGVDSFPIHVASCFDKKIVGLYCNMYSSQSKPYWSTDKNIKLIQADLKNNKPSYAPEENPKTIDFIKPEEIVNSILDLLEIKDKVSHESIFIGSKYGSLILESVPSVILPQDFFSNILLNIRFDYIEKIEEKDYLCTFNNLNTRNCSFITDKTLEIEKFANLKHKISNIFYDITFIDNIDLEFINKVKLLGIKIDFIFNKSKNQNIEFLNQKKYQLIEMPEIINIIEESQKPIDLLTTASYYKSNKLLFAQNNVYISKAAYLENKPIALKQDLNLYQSFSEILNKDLLIKEDGDYSLFYK